MAWVDLLVFDVLIFAMTLYKSSGTVLGRDFELVGRNRLTELLLRDGKEADP